MTSSSPHSLGTLIEWKLDNGLRLLLILLRPHSLGTLIEWKLKVKSVASTFSLVGPHSLGTLIEWKHMLKQGITIHIR